MFTDLTKYFKIILLSSLIILSGCTESNKTRISIKGSDTMLNFMQLAAEKYMVENKDVSISLSGGGSSIGIASLINGTSDIANISRSLKKRETDQINSLKLDFQKIPVALDSVTIIVNSNNPINSLTVQQLKLIYSGAITNWKNLGGIDKEIILYSRENSSGTYEFFKQKILDIDNQGSQVDFSTKIQLLQGTSAIAEAVSNDRNGIGYGGIGYFSKRDDVKVLKIYSTNQKEMVFSRQLYCYIKKNSKEEVAKFIKFLKSEIGQKIIEQSGFISLKN